MSDPAPGLEAADPSRSYRLPTAVVPRRYDIDLDPDLERAVFSGEVRIALDVKERVDRIVLNAADLSVDSAEVDGRPVGFELDEDGERLTLLAGGDLALGPATVVIAFRGALNDQLRGFYRSTFDDADGVTRTIATTQFEATDARRAFPCFDEPDRKAVFGITLRVPRGLAAYSNSPVVEEQDLSDGARRVRFGDTIPMSTYLVAFVVGPLVATDALDVDGVAVRVVHVPGREDLTAFALDVAAHALRFFTGWFGIPYPAPKLDLVAIPDFAFGAMENLGCVTFRETALLVDPTRSSRLEQERVADVVNHEIAHMWFGDLVTMRWWNGIWLNEAFATMMELLATDAYRPEWRRWVSFGMERDAAMATDALHSTRPVEYPVGPPEEAQGMFDVLTYQKGAGVLRMLERYLGGEQFRAGIRRYLDIHRYSNTDTSDLWKAIEAETGEPVRDIMDTWIFQGGFPLVRVEQSGSEVRLDQEPFTLAPATVASAVGEHWKVPVLLRAPGGSWGDERRILLDEPTTVEVETRGEPVVVNAGGSGFYRVHYERDHLRRLGERLDLLEELERFNLLGDTWAAVVAGRAELDDLFVLAESLGDESDPDVWSQVTGALGFLWRAVGDEAVPVLGRYTRALLAPPFRRLGWDARPGEGERIPTLRAQLLATLGTVGADDDVTSECRRRLLADFAGERAVDPELASAVAGVVATNSGVEQFDTFLERYRHPATPQEEMRYLYALAAFPDPELGRRAFDLALTEVRSQNAPFLVHALLTSRPHGVATWRRIESAWDQLVERIPANIVPRMVEGVRLLCRDRFAADAAVEFLATHPLATGQRTVDQAVERLGVNLAFAGRLTAGSFDAGLARLGA